MNGKRGFARGSQLADQHLAFNFEADDEEEEHHQEIVDPKVEILVASERAPRPT